MPALARLRGRRWAVIPPLSVLGFVLAGVLAEHASAQGLTYLALVAVPLLAAGALGWLTPGARPARALLVLPLFALAWADAGALAGEAAALTLSALSCVALGVLLAAVTPPRWLAAGIVAMALVDAALVVSDLLQRPNDALNAAHPAAGLPRLQSALLGSAVMGYGDLFIAGALGALLALTVGRGGSRARRCSPPCSRSLRPAVLLRRRAAGDRAGRAHADRRAGRVSAEIRGDGASSRAAGVCEPTGSSSAPAGAPSTPSRAVTVRAVVSTAGGLRDLAIGRSTGFLDLAHLRHDARVEGADGLVVGRHGRVELAPDLAERLDETAEAAVQLARGLGDLARGLGDLLLAPAVVHGPQQPDQRRRRGHQHLLVHAVLDQRRVLAASAAW